MRYFVDDISQTIVFCSADKLDETARQLIRFDMDNGTSFMLMPDDFTNNTFVRFAEFAEYEHFVMPNDAAAGNRLRDIPVEVKPFSQAAA